MRSLNVLADAPYGLAGLGLAIAAFLAVRAFGMAINARAFTDLVIKLATARNLDRLRKLAVMSPNAPFVRMVVAVVNAASHASPGPARMDAVRTAFELAYRTEATKLWRTVPLGLVALALLVSAPVVSAVLGRPADVWVLAPSGVGILALLHHALVVGGILVGSPREFRRAFPSLVGADGM